MKIKISHEILDFNLNEVVRQARASKYGSASKKKKLMRDLYFQIKPQVKGVLSGKYHVNALWLVPSKNRDLDNLLLKAILDCMQENGMLVNDNLNHIVSINHSFEVVKKDKQGVEIEFVEVA